MSYIKYDIKEEKLFLLSYFYLTYRKRQYLYTQGMLMVSYDIGDTD